MGGGALIAPDLVLTADHVAYVGDEVIWGGEVQELRGRRSERRRIVEVIRHPKADPETLEWDVAVARLNRPIRRVRSRLSPRPLLPMGQPPPAGLPMSCS